MSEVSLDRIIHDFNIPSTAVRYMINGEEVVFSNLSISKATFEELIRDLDLYYKVEIKQDQDDMSTYVHSFNAKKVLGLCIGLADTNLSIPTGVSKDGSIVFCANIEEFKSAKVELELDANGKLINSKSDNEENKKSATLENTKIFKPTLSEDLSNNVYITFIVGSQVNSFDHWINEYNEGHMLIVNGEAVSDTSTGGGSGTTTP